MDFGLAGKRALVGGGSHGIGRATALELLREGADVMICGRNPDALDAAVHVASGIGTLRTVAGDLSTSQGIADVIAAARNALGEVDILVTNTGGPPTMPALDADWSAWQHAVELLLRSAVELCQAFVPEMRRTRWGRVIGITSLAVKQPVENLVLSNAVRAAVTGYFRTLANEVSADGVTVNTVLPGYTATDRLQALADRTAEARGISREAAFDQWIAHTPARRLGEPEELSAVIAFLASARASFVTGQAICVDGGAVGTLL